MVFCTRRGLSSLQAKIEETASIYKAKLMVMRKEHADVKVGEVCVQNVLGGMRGIKGMLTQTSALDPHEGITFRGFTIDDIELSFPKKDHQPLPEGILHLLLTGEKPTEEDVRNLSRDLYDRGQRVSEHALDLIRELPKETHPMTALSIGLMACQT
jgi:citrate synthase